LAGHISCERCAGMGFLNAGRFADRAFSRCPICKGLGPTYIEVGLDREPPPVRFEPLTRYLEPAQSGGIPKALFDREADRMGRTMEFFRQQFGDREAKRLYHHAYHSVFKLAAVGAEDNVESRKTAPVQSAQAGRVKPLHEPTPEFSMDDHLKTLAAALGLPIDRMREQLASVRNAKLDNCHAHHLDPG
jgi:hypothetical protein